MKLNIKNARRMETVLLSEYERSVRQLKDVSRLEYPTIASAEEGTKRAISSYVEKLLELKRIRGLIRSKIAVFNAESGINELCSEIASLRMELELFTSLSEFSRPRCIDYGNNRAVKSFIGGLSVNDTEEFYAETLRLSRKIQRANDKCQGINASGTIELPSEVEATLKQFGLLD